MGSDKSRVLSFGERAIYLAVLVASVVFIITFSIGLPIYFRPFYYMQIEPLGLEDETGYTRDEIKEAYDEVLDYLTLPGKEFGTGVFKYSEDGASHFKDCKHLFTFNAVLFVFSGLVITIGVIFSKKYSLSLCSPKFGSVFSVSGIIALVSVSAIVALASLDFDRAFRIFHLLFFPGKVNWGFYPECDEIILALPIEFFLSCAILIAASVIFLSVLFIFLGRVFAKKQRL